jgi:hypothetical protein
MGPGLVARVQRLLMSPASEWAVIDAEPADVPAIYKNYVAPLVIVSSLAAMIGTYLLFSAFLRPALGGLLVSLLINIILTMVGIYVFAIIIDALAPTFGAQKNMGQAFKVAAYSPTASWIGSIFMIIPVLGWIIALIGAIYSLYLLFLGLPRLMKPNPGQGVPYTVVAIVAMIIIYVVIGYIAAAARVF